MRKSLGSKRKELSDTHIEEITHLFGPFTEAKQDGKPISRIFANADFEFSLLPGEVIITKDFETANDIAIVAFVPQELPGVICGYHLTIVRPSEKMFGRFVKRLFDSQFLNSPCGGKRMIPYVPQSLPLSDLDYGRLIRKVGPANAALARYDGLLQSVINPSILLSPLITREAVLSSKIEGTQATVDEVLECEAGIDFGGEKAQDIQEIRNYRKALVLASEALKERPFTLSLICQMHTVLMDSVRGANKTPGQFRLDQNWIGPAGCTFEQATFVPPAPLQLRDHLQAWESYLAMDDFDLLVQVAVVHAQFELIHPFKDGNGRIGRLLIPLFLFQKHVLASPMFYLSEYLETHRDLYYARLRGISQDDDWISWIEFFLDAIVEQAWANTQKVREILELYEKMKRQITELTRSQHAIQVLDALFDRPIFQSGDFILRSGIPKHTALPFLHRLREAGILHPLREKSGRRSAIFAFRELLNCAEGRNVL
ncbi:MAG: Fic family protein [Magnetococcus sp. DMHC-6]